MPCDQMSISILSITKLMRAADDLEWFLKARMCAKLDTAEDASSVLPVDRKSVV